MLNPYLNNNYKDPTIKLSLSQTRPTYKKSKKYLTLDEEKTSCNILSSRKDNCSKRKPRKIEMK